MKTAFTPFVALILYLLLTGSQCTETVITTQVDAAQKISDDKGSFSGDLDAGDNFGAAVANIGDLEGDGVVDLAVGAPGDDDNGDNRGAVWILFLNSDGRVDIWSKISDTSGGFVGELDDNDRFGSAAAGIGDLNGDGFLDIAVGAPFDDDGGDDRGAVWILFMNSNGEVREERKIASGSGDFGGNLNDGDLFGSAIAGIGDLDGGGVDELAVGAEGTDDGGIDRGAIWVLFMKTNGKVNEQIRVSGTQGKFNERLDDGDTFGSALAGVGNLNNDKAADIAAGTPLDDDDRSDAGAVYILFMERKEDKQTKDFFSN